MAVQDHEHFTDQEVEDFLSGNISKNFEMFAWKQKNCERCRDKLGAAWQKKLEDRQNLGSVSMG